MDFITVNDLIKELIELQNGGYGDKPVLLFIDPDQSYSKRITQPLLDIKPCSIMDESKENKQDAIGLFNVKIVYNNEENE